MQICKRANSWRDSNIDNPNSKQRQRGTAAAKTDFIVLVPSFPHEKNNSNSTIIKNFDFKENVLEKFVKM